MPDLASFHIEKLGDTNLLIVRDEANNVLCTTASADYLRSIIELLQDHIGSAVIYERPPNEDSEVETLAVAEPTPTTYGVPTVKRRYRPIKKYWVDDDTPVPGLRKNG
jgi:hypothetical protein